VQALLLITTQSSPTLKDDAKWSPKFKHFLKCSMHMDAAKRASSESLLLVRPPRRACGAPAVRCGFCLLRSTVSDVRCFTVSASCLQHPFIQTASTQEEFAKFANHILTSRGKK
jgi:hypothetical protein